MCQCYTFCQQRKRKLYSVGYKMVISCFANIPINPSLWCYSTVEKQNRREASSFPSCRDPSTANIPKNPNEEIFLFLLLEDRLLEARQGGGNGGSERTTEPTPAWGWLPLGCIPWAPKIPSFPNELMLTIWGLPYLLVSNWTSLGFVILFCFV